MPHEVDHMPDPQYRRRLQDLTDMLLMTLPASWQEVTLRTGFPSGTSTSLEISFRGSLRSQETSVSIPTPMTPDFARAARAVLAELVLAGNPGCQGYVFRLSKSGKSSLDVEY